MGRFGAIASASAHPLTGMLTDLHGLESHSAAVRQCDPARPGRRGSIPARQEAHLPGGGREAPGAVPRTRGCGRARSVGETDSMPVAHADTHRRRAMTSDDNGDLGPERRPAPRIGLPAVPRVPVQPDAASDHRPRTPPGVHAIGDGSRTADAEGRIGAGARGAGCEIARSAPAVVTTRARREGACHRHAQDQSRHPPHRGVLRAASRQESRPWSTPEYRSRIRVSSCPTTSPSS
jgi:hypothetical protein